MLNRSLYLFFFSVAVLTHIGVGRSSEYRTIDGSDNNVTNPSWGEADGQLLRLAGPSYDDSISSPRGGNPSSLPSPRAISNAVSAQSTSVLNSAGASDWLWQWGQFLDHDIDLTEGASPAESFDIPVPQGDLFFDPFSTGTQVIGLNRSVYDPTTGTSSLNPRQQLNEISSYIDGSNVYGSDATRAAALRDSVNGMGLLATSAGNLLPFNTGGLANAGGASSSLFLAGDVRANEQIGLTAVHTLFVREHNTIATDLKARLDNGDVTLTQKLNDSGLSLDDFLYESSRKLVGAEIQKITYEEFLPMLLGSTLSPFAGYDDSVNAGIANEFSTAAYRVGHTMLSPELKRLNSDGSIAPEGSIALQDSFFNPQEIVDHGIDSLLMGLCQGQAQEIDTLIVDDVRNFLFGPPGAGGFDLASLNIQRGRDHGLQSLNDFRINGLGLAAYASFLDMTGGDSVLAAQFASVYASVDDVDLWTGGLAEPHVNGGMLGETFSNIIEDQFLRLRDGDRFFYLEEIDHLLALDPNFTSTRFSDILMRNTAITGLGEFVFILPTPVPEPTTQVLALLALGFMIHRRRNLVASACAV